MSSQKFMSTKSNLILLGPFLKDRRIITKK